MKKPLLHLILCAALVLPNVAEKFNEIRQAGGRNKALVIMNYRHAFPHLRAEITGQNRSAEEIAKEIEQSQTVRTCGYEDKEIFPKSDYVQKIQQWLTAKR